MAVAPRVSTLTDAVAANDTGTTFVFPGQTGNHLIQIIGITTATVAIQGSLDGGTTWYTLATKTADELFSVPGALAIRAVISGWSAGTISVYAVETSV